jgi:hypothetical protein
MRSFTTNKSPTVDCTPTMYFQIYNSETKEEETIPFRGDNFAHFTESMKEYLIREITINHSCSDAIREFFNTQKYFGLFTPTLLPGTTVYVRLIYKEAYVSSHGTITNFLAK